MSDQRWYPGGIVYASTTVPDMYDKGLLVRVLGRITWSPTISTRCTMAEYGMAKGQFMQRAITQ